MKKPSEWLLIILLAVNLLIFAVILGDSVNHPYTFNLFLEVIFIIPILLSLASLKWSRYFSLYPAYFLSLAHIGALLLWFTFIVLTFGLALLFQIFSFGMIWPSYPFALSLIVLQDFLWTIMAAPILANEIMKKHFSWKINLLQPVAVLTTGKKIVFWIAVVLYTLFILIYYLFLLGDYGFDPFIGPPS